MATLLPAPFGLIEAHRLEVTVGGAFRVDQVAETSAPMEENGVDGKIVVLP